MSLTIQEIKALPRTAEGCFDLSAVLKCMELTNEYEAAALIYPAYAAYETTENKKEGYPDIVSQLRVWKKRADRERTFESGVGLAGLLLNTVLAISPEIYENYRELLDMFRDTVKRLYSQYYDVRTGDFSDDVHETEVFRSILDRACKENLLLAEKYSGRQ